DARDKQHDEDALSACGQPAVAPSGCRLARGDLTASSCGRAGSLPGHVDQYRSTRASLQPVAASRVCRARPAFAASTVAPGAPTTLAGLLAPIVEDSRRSPAPMRGVEIQHAFVKEAGLWRSALLRRPDRWTSVGEQCDLLAARA